jgi:hypothetical protein
MRTRSRLAAVMAAVVLALAAFVVLGAASATAKKPRPCTLLKASEISKVFGVTVTGPGNAGTLDIACSFDIGPGLGEAGGGSLIVQYYKKGPVASTVFSQMKAGTEGYKDPGERVAGTKVWWDGADAWVEKKGNVVSIGASYTNNDPTPDSVQDAVVKLAKRARRKI